MHRRIVGGCNNGHGCKNVNFVSVVVVWVVTVCQTWQETTVNGPSLILFVSRAATTHQNNLFQGVPQQDESSKFT
jgi:hypothetical protein